MASNLLSVGPLGMGLAAPERVVSNDDLSLLVDTSDEWISSRTGIRTRRILDAGQDTSDLAAAAATGALAKAGLEPEQIDLVLVATASPDMNFPSVAAQIQGALGLKRAAAADLSAACSGFIYGLDLAAAQIQTGRAQHVLLVGADALSKLLDWTDRTTCVLFGDGAGAAVIGAVPEGYGLLGTSLGADGTGGEFLKVSSAGRADGRPVITMAGREVYRFAVRIQPMACRAALEAANLTIEDVDWFVPHQANVRIIDAADRLGLPPEKVLLNLNKYGNTSAASIPIMMAEAVADGRIKRDDVVLTLGFGAGLTWGAAVLRWY